MMMIILILLLLLIMIIIIMVMIIIIIITKRRVPNLKVQSPNRLMQIGLDMGRAKGADAFNSKLTPIYFFTTRKLLHLPTFRHQIELSAMKNNGARNFDAQTFF